jgi:hypothetical protein
VPQVPVAADRQAADQLADQHCLPSLLAFFYVKEIWVKLLLTNRRYLH